MLDNIKYAYNEDVIYIYKNDKVRVGEWGNSIFKNTGDIADLDIELGYRKLYINKDTSLDDYALHYIQERLNPDKIFVTLKNESDSYDGSVIYNQKETIKLADNINQLSQQGVDVLFGEYSVGLYDYKSDNCNYTLDEVLSANRQIDEVVNHISSAKNKDGEPLSPLEKFVCAYHYVSKRFKYKQEQKGDRRESRDLISILNGDRVVCVGYATTLIELCKRLGLDCKYVGACVVGKYITHAMCMVRIDDDKYEKHGAYYSDPTNLDIQDCLLVSRILRSFGIKRTEDIGLLDSVEKIYNTFAPEATVQADNFVERVKIANSVKELSKDDRKAIKLIRKIEINNAKERNRLFKSNERENHRISEQEILDGVSRGWYREIILNLSYDKIKNTYEYIKIANVIDNLKDNSMDAIANLAETHRYMTITPKSHSLLKKAKTKKRKVEVKEDIQTNQSEDSIIL